VLVSFWATWCGPCMKMIPHERAIVDRLKDKPFVLVGVNGDEEPKELKKAVEKHDIIWRSFKNERTNKKTISGEWKVAGWPTLYLIDHEGIIRKYWCGSPGDDVLDREIDSLVEAAMRASSRDKSQTGKK
jgi:thiol-disulfide isomerase/thioredoxin